MRAAATATPEGNPLPHRAHLLLPEPATRHRRIIIIGDIHGCAGELRSLLDKCSYRKGVDIAISVGDLVNKGPSSLDVLKTIKEEEMYAVRGNHDDAALAAYNAFAKYKVSPSKEKYQWVTELSSSNKEYSQLVGVLEELPFSLSLPGYKVATVHAGVVPGRAVEEQRPDDLLKMRDVVPTSVLEAVEANPPESESDAEIDQLHSKINKEESMVENGDQVLERKELPEFDWEACTAALNSRNGISSTAAESILPVPALEGSERRHPAGRAWASVWRGPNHVFFGHDASRKLQLEPWATGLDGGCVYGGALYAAILPALDEHGEIMEGRLRAGIPGDAQEITLGTGLSAWLVKVPATEVHSPPKIKAPAAVEESDVV